MSAPAVKSSRPVNKLYEQSLELADIMKAHPEMVEKSMLASGQNLVGIFVDETFKDKQKNLRKLQRDTLKLAIEDMAMGALTLRHSSIGLCFFDGKLQPYIMPIGSLPMGSTIYSINLKNSVAFKAFRFDDGSEIPRETIEPAVYFLVYHLSLLL